MIELYDGYPNIKKVGETLMERTDNMQVVPVADKKKVLRDIIDKQTGIIGLFSVDFVEFVIDDVSALSIVEAIKQADDNRYLWVYKQHNNER